MKPKRSETQLTSTDAVEQPRSVSLEEIVDLPGKADEVGTPDPGPLIGEVIDDGERIVLRAEKEIELRCGEASITLTKSGKVIIRGTYVSSRSTGMNRINGASVQIN